MSVVFGKVYSTQNSLLAMLERWKSVVSKTKRFEDLEMDSCGSFHFISCKFLLENLSGHGYSTGAGKRVRGTFAV